MDQFQKKINRMMGVSDEAWKEYSPEAIDAIRKRENQIQTISLKIDALEGSVNKVMGMLTHKGNIREADEIQEHINRMMGVSDAVWAKYGPKN